MDEWRLLRECVENNSQAAFAGLIERYINLVYSTCLREVRDSALAEDATQLVFLILARKAAGLREGTVLAGWLFQAARFVSKNALQQETRRQKREQQAMGEMIDELQAGVAEATETAAWQEMEPLLHEALASLSRQDRDVLLLRFFEGKSLKDTGLALGISEEAAKKRVARALEKMRRYFAQHGFRVSGVVLATLLGAHAVRAAPAPCVAATMRLALSPSVTAMTADVIGVKLFPLWEVVLRATVLAQVKVAVAVLLCSGLIGLGARQFTGRTMTGSLSQSISGAQRQASVRRDGGAPAVLATPSPTVRAPSKNR